MLQGIVAGVVALVLMVPLVGAEFTSVAGADTAIPIGPGSSFTLYSKGETRDPLHLDTDGPVDIEFSEVVIEPGGTTGALGRPGTLVVNVDQSVATIELATGASCVTQTVSGGQAVVHAGDGVSAIKNLGRAPVTMHLTAIRPDGAVAPANTGSCPAAAPSGATVKVLNRSRFTEPLTADATGTSDVYVGIVRADPGRSAGPWHAHPGPLLVAVDRGTATVHMAHGSSCETMTVPAGVAFPEMTGMVHEATNRGTEPLAFYILGFAPSGQPLLTPRPTPSECQGR